MEGFYWKKGCGWWANRPKMKEFPPNLSNREEENEKKGITYITFFLRRL